MAVLLAQLPGPIRLVLKTKDLKFADILHDLLIAKGNRSGVPRALAVDRNEPRELAGTLHIEGMGKDDAIAQIRAINALVTVGTTTLTLRSTGATNAVTLNILPSRGVSPPLDELFELPAPTDVAVLASCPFSFLCEPYAYGPETVVYTNAAAVLPNVIDIDVPGDYPTPLRISFDQIASGAVHAMYIGMLPDQATPLSSLLRPASYAQYAGTCYVNAGNPATVGTSSPHGLASGQTVEFWGDTAFPALNGIRYLCTVTDATHFSVPVNVTFGGNATLTTFTSAPAPVSLQGDGYCYSGAHAEYSGLNSWASWEIDDRLLPPGTYRPLVRMKQAGAGVDSVYLSGAAGVNVAGPGFFSTNTIAAYSLDPMSATLRLPYYGMPEPGATWYTPKLWWAASGGTPTLYMDYLALMPISWGWVAWHDAYPAIGAANWMLGYDGIISKNLVTSAAGRSGGLTAVGAQRLFMVAAERHDAAHASAVTGRLIIYATPRYALWR